MIVLPQNWITVISRGVHGQMGEKGLGDTLSTVEGDEGKQSN